MKQLHEEKNLIIRPADKGRCIVVMDKLDDVNKVKSILSDGETYKVLREDPTKKMQEKMNKLLKKCKQQGHLKKLYQLLVH